MIGQYDNKAKVKFGDGAVDINDDDLTEGFCVREKVKDRRVVKILRKYLDMDLNAEQLVVFNHEDFEALGELLHDLLLMVEPPNNLLKQFGRWYERVVNDEDEKIIYNIFLEFGFNEEFDDLAILPWEYFFYRQRQKDVVIKEPFIAANRTGNINLYRKIPIAFTDARDQSAFVIEWPLKVLCIIAEPSGNLELKKKEDVLKFFLKMDEELGDKIQVRYLIQPDANREDFTNELDNGAKILRKFTHPDDVGDEVWKQLEEKQHNKTFSPQVIHFVGHGSITENKGVLIFPEYKDIDELYREKPMEDADFARCIEVSRLDPKLVFLHTCNGGRIVDFVKKSGTAINLIDKQIPFVIAMQNSIQENNALDFAAEFYDAFLEGNNIGISVTRGRYRLSEKGKYNQKVFGSPVLLTYTNYPLVMKQKEVVEDIAETKDTSKAMENYFGPTFDREHDNDRREDDYSKVEEIYLSREENNRQLANPSGTDSRYSRSDNIGKYTARKTTDSRDEIRKELDKRDWSEKDSPKNSN